jgi:hypothetical protein
VFNDINMAQSDQFFASTNEGYNEVWWFYCSANSTVIDKYVVYNHLERIWYYGTMGRTAWLDSSLRAEPMAVTYGTPGGSTRTKDLVFVTNGILQEKDVDFVHDTLNQNAINALVAKKKKQGLLPELTGVRVHYVGLGVADRPITAPQVKAIESFWVAFAKRAGATDVTSVRAGNQVALPSAGDAE